MAIFSSITSNYSVAGQLDESGFSKAKKAGFKTIVNFRPDNEKPGYIDAKVGAKMAQENNLEYHHIPVNMTGPTPDQIKTFSKLLSEGEKPILAHCGTGKRAAILWAFALGSKMSPDDKISCCKDAGHDISKLRPHL